MKDLSLRFAPVVTALPAASAALAGSLVRLLSDNHPYWCDGSSWVDLQLAAASDARLTTARLAADVTNSTVTMANATGLAVALDANTTYAISARVLFQTAATTCGIRLSQAVPSGASVYAQWNTPTSLTASTLANQRAADTGAATSAIDTANATTLACAEIVVANGASAGSLQVRFATEVAGTNAVVKAGSHLIAHRIA